VKKWAIALILLAGLDILTTYFCLSSGAVEANPFFHGMTLPALSLIKMGVYIPLACVAVHFKFRTLLIFGTGANAAVVVANLMAIWTLRTM
jgi:hypothetical protein